MVVPPTKEFLVHFVTQVSGMVELVLLPCKWLELVRKWLSWLCRPAIFGSTYPLQPVVPFLVSLQPVEPEILEPKLENK